MTSKDPKDEPPNISDPSFSYETSPHLFLFTSLTAGSSHIITATSRMETILKANRIPFYAIDTATDEKARRIWTRRSKGKTIPGLVKQGMVLGDLEQVEEWNEFGEIKDVLGVKKKKKKSMPDKAVSGKENEPKELKTDNAPPAPDMPRGGEKELPIRTKQPEAMSDAPATVRDATRKPSGQSSLAAEVAAMAQKRTKDKAAALKASVEAKQKETAKGGEDAEEKGGTLMEAAVDDEVAAAPAGGLAEDGSSKVAGPEAVTNDPENLKKEEEEARRKQEPSEVNEEVNEPEPPKRSSIAVHGEAPAESSLNAALALKSGEETTTDDLSVQAGTDEDGDRKITLKPADSQPERETVETSLDAAPAAKSGEEAVTNAPASSSKMQTEPDATVALETSGVERSSDPIDSPLDAGPSVKSGDEAVTSKPKSTEEKVAVADATSALEKASTTPSKWPVDSVLVAAPSAKSGEAAITSNPSDAKQTPQASKAEAIDEAVSAESIETTQPKAEATAQSKESSVLVPADDHTIRKAEKENVLPEAPEKGNPTSQEELGVSREPKQEALDGDKATESVED